MSNSLAEELRRIRGVRDVSLREVEKATKISNAYLSQLERGSAVNPSPNVLYKLAQFYNVPYISLMKAAGYLKEDKKTHSKPNQTALHAALMSTDDLTEKEHFMVAQYIEFLKSQRRKKG